MEDQEGHDGSIEVECKNRNGEVIGGAGGVTGGSFWSDINLVDCGRGAQRGPKLEWGASEKRLYHRGP